MLMVDKCIYGDKKCKSVYIYKKTKMGKMKRDLVWQYYRDRNRQSVESVLDRYKDTQLKARIIYSGDPIIYTIVL
jgi:hypothetical protein